MGPNIFWYKQGEAYCESVPLSRIAEQVGTPAYVYSQAAIAENSHRIKAAFSSYPTIACYAVKANSNLTILKEIFSHGFGADVVSVGELERCLRANVKPEHVVFSGVGKQASEMRRALDAGILAFNVESADELDLLSEVAEGVGKEASVNLRINPNIEVKTNPHIATGLYRTKFGITEEEARRLGQALVGHPRLKLRGLSCHLGSQIQDLEPYAEAARRMATLCEEFKKMGHALKEIDLGGGFAIRYHDENPPEMEEYAKTMIAAIRKTELTLIIEPGRSVVGNSGVILSRVVSTKRTPVKRFLVIDAAMNDLIRPSLYDGHHPIAAVHASTAAKDLYDVVGPICETGDFLGLDRELPMLKRGDLVWIQQCGAYAASMASNYNSRPRAPEVLVQGSQFSVIRTRENLESLWKAETDLQK